MKKLYRKGSVHPSPPPPSSSSLQSISDQHLALIPATILTLTVALSPEDKEVLAYLISCSSTSCLLPNNNRRNNNINKSSPTTTSTATARGAGSSSNGKSGDHPTQFNCNCFRCYMSYWVRWDSSPNRQLIHEVIDAFEDTIFKKEKNKKDRRKKVTSTMTISSSSSGGGGGSGSGGGGTTSELPAELNRLSENALTESNLIKNDEDGDGEVDVNGEKGPVRKIVSFLGDRIWGVWT